MEVAFSRAQLEVDAIRHLASLLMETEDYEEAWVQIERLRELAEATADPEGRVSRRMYAMAFAFNFQVRRGDVEKAAGEIEVTPF